MMRRDRRLRAPAGGGDTLDSGRPPPSGPAVLDLAALARLSELDPTGANRLVERVLQAFKTSVARLRPQAEAARLNGDPAGIRLVAHTLKSSSASIGALRLSALCAAIEASIREDEHRDQSAQLDALGVALDEALAAIELRLKGAA